MGGGGDAKTHPTSVGVRSKKPVFSSQGADFFKTAFTQ